MIHDNEWCTLCPVAAAAALQGQRRRSGQQRQHTAAPRLHVRTRGRESNTEDLFITATRSAHYYNLNYPSVVPNHSI